MALRVLCPAKVNLFLHVLGRRPDGYHDIFSLICGIGIYDEIRLHAIPEGVRISCSDPELPAGEDNLAARAARRFGEALGRPLGVAIRLEKRIPVAAGLGGGSSDAAGVLLGLNRLHGHPFDAQGLRRIGRGLGADVPFFLFGPPALAAGIGDELKAYAALPPLHALVVTPAFGVSTRMVYQKFDLELTRAEKRPTSAHFENTVFAPGRHLQNDLEAVTLALAPELRRLKELLLAAGAEGALMSGSGPSVYGLFGERKAALRAVRALPREEGWRFFCAELLSQATPWIEEEGTSEAIGVPRGPFVSG